MMIKQTFSEVYLTGTLVQDFVPDFTDSFGNTYSKSLLRINRNSGVQDLVPLLCKHPVSFINDIVSVRGIIQTRTCNGHLNLFVKAFSIVAAQESNNGNNIVYITGFICKPVVCRETPLGRKIAEVMLAVNDLSHSFYIPCIAWGQNASFVANVPVGTQLSVQGRFQSRIYTKILSSGESVERTAYEISLGNLTIIS